MNTVGFLDLHDQAEAAKVFKRSHSMVNLKLETLSLELADSCSRSSMATDYVPARSSGLNTYFVKELVLSPRRKPFGSCGITETTAVRRLAHLL